MKKLAIFYLVDLIHNVVVADLAFGMQYRWWLDGIAGAMVGVVWIFSTSIFTWQRK